MKHAEFIALLAAKGDKTTQLVLHYDDVSLAARKQMRWPAAYQQKADGVWCGVCRINECCVVFFSRTGKEFYIEVNPCDVAVLEFNVVYITELINPELSLEELSGLVNPNRVNPWSPDLYTSMANHAKLQYHDYLTLDEFLAGCSSTEYQERHQLLNESLMFTGEAKNILSYQLVHSYSEFKYICDVAIDKHNDEGGCLKQLHGDWVAGHKGWRVTKYVRGIHADLECIGVVWGKEGKFFGLIAGLTFLWKGKKFNAGLGEGWDTPKMVALRTLHEEEQGVIGKVWHVSALQESSKGVLRLPKVNELRVDKDVPDAGT